MDYDRRTHARIELTSVVRGDGPTPALVLSAVTRLPDTSHYRASRMGGAEHTGWGQDRHMVADLFDGLMLVAKSNAGKKAKLPTYPRPKAKPVGEKRKKTVADLYRSFQNKM